MRPRMLPSPVPVGGPRNPDGRLRCNHRGDPEFWPGHIQDAERFCGRILDETLKDWGMYLTDEEYNDALCGLIERCLRLERTYDPDRSPSFAGYARYILSLRVADVGPRHILGRTGLRIAERAHAELDEAALGGSRPWETESLESGGSDLDRGPDAGGVQRNRDRQRAWADTLVRQRAA